MERVVEVTISVRVKTDDSKFTPEFMEEFRKGFFPFFDVDDHAKHIAQLKAREIASLSGLSEWGRKEFVEGYGPIGEFGIDADILDQWEEIVERQEGPVA